MPHPSPTDLSERFCSYCGYPPGGEQQERVHHVCACCGAGVVLCAPPGMAPHPGDPFLIVDRGLAVQTLSRNAEALLLLDRDTASGVPLDKVLIAERTGPRVDFANVIKLAVAGSPPVDALELTTARDPEIRLQGRLSSCGLTAAALLVLTPVGTRGVVPEQTLPVRRELRSDATIRLAPELRSDATIRLAPEANRSLSPAAAPCQRQSGRGPGLGE